MNYDCAIFWVLAIYVLFKISVFIFDSISSVIEESKAKKS